MKNTVIVSVLASVIVFVVGMFFVKPVQNITQNLGATPGADFNSPCETHNGVQTCFYNVAMNQASTTNCSLRSPSATSTLARPPIISTSVSTSSAYNLVVAKGTNTNASTTLLTNTIAYGANVLFTEVATSTALNIQNTDWIFAPNTFLNISMNGGAGTYSPTGRCIAEFESVSPVNR